MLPGVRTSHRPDDDDDGGGEGEGDGGDEGVAAGLSTMRVACGGRVRKCAVDEVRTHQGVARQDGGEGARRALGQSHCSRSWEPALEAEPA